MKRDFVERGVEGEQGFMLVGLIVAIFLILLALSVAAPKVAQDLRREREVEAVHRGNQYVRAIRLYYRKTGMYPASIEALEKTNNVRYLRQRYLDPMTGKADWRLIKVGEAKTTVKGFFGQPLAGLTPGLGSVSNQVSAGQGAAGAGQQSSTLGGSSTGGYGSSSFGGSSGTPTLGGSSGTPTPGGSSGSSSTPTLGGDSSSTPTLGGSGSSTPGSTIGASGQSGSGPSGGAPFVGVGIPKEGDSITILNEQTTYNTWEFIYDPRIEQLYAKGALLGGVPSGGLGTGNGGNTSAPGGTSSPGFGGTSTPGLGGSTPGSTYPTTPTTTPPPQ
jgi:type II secretory pathway pseudopilin PulG